MPVNSFHNEKALLLQVAEGDEAAFKMLFDAHRVKLYHYIAGIIKCSEAAEEIVMDVFLKIWLSRDMMDSIENFNAFLFRIAYNKSIDFLRAAAHDQTLSDLLWDKVQVAADNAADNKIIAAEYESMLNEAIDLLSPKRKLVYRLSREEGLSHEQIASELKLSRNTVNNHIVESRRFIQSYLLNQINII